LFFVDSLFFGLTHPSKFRRRYPSSVLFWSVWPW